MPKIINVITVSAELDTMFEARVNEALADGWELKTCTVVPGPTTRLFAVMLRDEEESRVPGKAPGKVKGKGKDKAESDAAESAVEVPAEGAVTMVPDLGE